MGGGAGIKASGARNNSFTCRVIDDASSACFAQGQQAAIVNSEGGWFANDAAIGVLVCKLVLFAN